MKKILILILIILLLVLTCFAILKGISFAKISSIKDIKNASNKLDQIIDNANVLAEKTYPSEKQELETAIINLKKAKEEYESKNPYNAEELNIGAVEVKTYKIHYLWTILGNYRKDEGVRSINLDLKSTTAKNIYDLQFTLVGNYVSITDFLYDIEDDEELKFEIKNLNIAKTEQAVATTSNNTNTITNSIKSTNTVNTTNKNTVNTTSKNTLKTKQNEDPSEGGTILKATFTVENVGITLD